MLNDERPDQYAADQWFTAMEAAVAEIEPVYHLTLEAAIAEADRIAKAQTRREMGLKE